MARTGRPKSNPTLLEASGAYRKNPDRRPDESTAIKAIVGRPEPSILIQADELTTLIWNETCDILDSMSILNTSDKFLIESYCLNSRELFYLTQLIQANGHGQLKDDGTRVTCPNVVSWHKCMGTHIKLMNELGLTPQARMRMVSPSVESDSSDKVTDLMNSLGGK